MPIYEYKCTKCNYCFEALRFASDNEGPICPQCGSPQVQRQMSCFATGVGGGAGLAGLDSGGGFGGGGGGMGGCGSGSGGFS
jgi:putative FmdB family regulatory protein